MIGVLDIRKKGIKAIEEELKDKGIGIIGYRGKKKYVILDIEEYERLREAELEVAYNQTLQDYEKGKFEVLQSDEDIEKHIESI